jgi:diguanylate cyclase (GGDEF)-like protein/PAS domain S-box-containing protein
MLARPGPRTLAGTKCLEGLAKGKPYGHDSANGGAGAETMKLPEQLRRLTLRLTSRFVLALSALLLLVLFVGLGWLWADIRSSILAEEEDRAQSTVEGLKASLQTLMLTGDAGLTRDWLERVAEQPLLLKIDILRPDGALAFRDLATIEQVNRHLGTERFGRPPLPAEAAQGVPRAALTKALAGQRVEFLEGGAQGLTQLVPITASAPCRGCHTQESGRVLGVLRVTTSLAFALDRIEAARRHSALLALGTLLVLGLAVLWLVRRQVVRPLHALEAVAQRIQAGDTEARSHIERPDEIGSLARAFDQMTERLGATLARYQSLSTYYRDILDRLPTGVVVYDTGLRPAYVNARMLEITGMSREEFLRSTCCDLCPAKPGGHSDHCLQCIQVKMLDAPAPMTAILPRLRKDGSQWISRARLVPLLGENGQLQEVLEIWEDITEDQRRVEEIKWLSTLPEMNPFPIIEVDVRGQVLYQNPATTRYLRDHGMDSRDLRSILPPGFARTVRECRRRKAPVDTVSFEVGNEVMVWQLHPNENNDNVRAYAIDITSRMHAEQAALRLAHHDPLTGLPNRILFYDRLERAMAMVRRRRQLLALLFIDLDRFKPINDNLGHHVGDEVLKEVGARLHRAVRETDTVARIGGDEFVIVLQDVGGDEAIVKVTNNTLAALSKPIAADGYTFDLSASIGIALYPRDAENADALLQRADQAMYQAKQEGGNRYRFFGDARLAEAD